MVILTALVVVGAMQIIGVILVAAMLVVPVAGATQAARSFTESLLVSVVLAELAVVLGIGVAHYGGATAGSVIAFIAVAICIAAVALGRRQTRFSEETVPNVERLDVEETERTSD